METTDCRDVGGKHQSGGDDGRTGAIVKNSGILERGRSQILKQHFSRFYCM